MALPGGGGGSETADRIIADSLDSDMDAAVGVKA